MNLVTPKAGAKKDLLFNKPASDCCQNHKYLKKLITQSDYLVQNPFGRASANNKDKTKQADPKQRRQPNCLVGLPDLSAWLPCWPACFALCPLLALVLQSGFLQWLLTVLTR
jgi:hypothetical protein